MRIFLPLAVLAVATAAPASAQDKPLPQKTASDTTGVYALRAVTDLPRPVDVEEFRRALATTYPPELRLAGVSGEVTVRFIVEADGKVSHITVVRSTETKLDAPTLAAVRTLRFTPARVAGRPVRVWVLQPVQWTIADE